MPDDFFESLLQDLDQEVFSSPPTKSTASVSSRAIKPRPARSPVSSHKRVALDPLSPQACATDARRSIASVSSPSANNVRKSAFDALCEGFDGFDNEDEEVLGVTSAVQRPNAGPARWTGRDPRPPDHIPLGHKYIRGVVESVELIPGDGQRSTRKNVLVRLDKEKLLALARLEDDWIQTRVQVDDIAHLIGEWEASEPQTVFKMMVFTRAKNYFIVHPDTLVSATRTADAAHCPRKPVLMEKVRSSGKASLALVYGNILHAVLQACLRRNQWDDAARSAEIDRQISLHGLSLWEAECEFDDARTAMLERSSSFQPWADKYLSDAIKPDAFLTDPHGTGNEARLCVTDVHDIEEEILSPRLGLKGKVDVSLLTRSLPPGSAGAGLEVPPLTMPLEVKSGRKLGVMEHRAQTMLYTLLMSERYDTSIESGLLLYTHGTDLIQVQAARNELRGLVIARNELASYLHIADSVEKPEEEVDDEFSVIPDPSPAVLPPPIDHERSCPRCYAADSCMLYRKAIEGSNAIGEDSDGLQRAFEAKTGHLTEKHRLFFRHWEGLASLEEQDSVRYKKEIWAMSATAREKAGRCFANMIVEQVLQEDVDTSIYVYRMRKSGSEASDLLVGHMAVNDVVCLSVINGAFAVARGGIAELTPTSVTVRLDHSLSQLACVPSNVYPVSFRIDKDELTAGMGRMRDNIAQLFYADGDERTRSLVVDLVEPRFQPTSTLEEADYGALNEDQRHAVDHVMAAQDYALILGMPGTGKTQTVSALLRILVRQGKSVLLTSYTHSAVDNILLKVRDLGDEVLRLGTFDKVMPVLQSLTLDAKPRPSSLSDIDRHMLRPRIVATTALTVVTHSLFARRRFDVCIVDEASQINLPACLGPLRFADRFVLVGDHNQLPPLVRNERARRGGFDVSLFRLLSEAHPQAVSYLSKQYRMNQDIMAISNRLVYGGRLSCGDTAVAARRLELPNRDVNDGTYPNWLAYALDPQRSVIFFDTDAISAREARFGRLVHNTIEANLIGDLTRALLNCGLPATEVAILTPYRQQLKTIQQHTDGLSREIEIITADRSQGRDKECVIISLVRSNSQERVGELLRDWRRLNVCFTRARSKLVVFGSRKTLSCVPQLGTFFAMADERGWTHLMEDPKLSIASPRRPLSHKVGNV